MAAGDDLAAAQLAHGLREMGVTRRSEGDSPPIRCASRRRCSRSFERLMASLVKRGLLKKNGDGYRADARL